jgi:hypothetical protein
MRANRRDANEKTLLKVLEKLGGFWIPLNGAPFDGVVYHWRTGWVPVEIKDPKKAGHKNEFKPSQERFFERCDARRAQYMVWRTELDVIKDLGGRE